MCIAVNLLFLTFAIASLLLGPSMYYYSMIRAPWFSPSSTCPDEEVLAALHQAVGGSDDPQLAEDGAPAEQQTAGTVDQPHLGKGAGGTGHSS